MGRKTFGKGIAQEFFDIKDGSGLKLTTGAYYLPDGDCIHKKGIEPDIKLKKDSNPKDDVDEEKNEAIRIADGLKEKS